MKNLGTLVFLGVVGAAAFMDRRNEKAKEAADPHSWIPSAPGYGSDRPELDTRRTGRNPQTRHRR